MLPALPVLPPRAAAQRVQADHEILLAHVDAMNAEALIAPFRTSAGPLGDFCESLHDLAAHVLMWDEISLAVMSEAEAGRTHWSLDSQWETPEIGRQLNQAGVAAGRMLPSSLLLHRLSTVHKAVMAELQRFDERSWAAPAPSSEGGTLGQLAEYAWTVPGSPPYWHAAIHLGYPLEPDSSSLPRGEA